MSVDREYRIRISIVADPSGAQNIARELDNLSPKTQKYIQSLRDGGEAAEGMDISHRNLRTGLSLLGPQFAQVGHLGLAAFANPLTAGFIAVSLAAGKLYNDWKKMREAVETQVDVSGLWKVIDALGQEGMLKALTEGGAAAEEFWGHINRLASEQESLKNKTEDAIAAIKKETEAHDQAMGAKEKAELAELKLAETLHRISPEDAARNKAQSEDRDAGQRANRRAIEQDRILEARSHEREVAERVIEEGPGVVTPKRLAAEEAKGTLEGEKAKLEEWKKKLDEINKWFVEKSKNAPLSAYQLQDRERRLALKEIVNLEQGTIPAAEVKAKTTGEELAEANRKVDEAVKSSTELKRQISTLEADRARERATAVELGTANQRSRRAEVSEDAPRQRAFADSDLEAATRTALKLADNPAMYRARHAGTTLEQARRAVAKERQEPVSGEEQRQMMDLSSRIAGHRTGFAESISVMGRAAQDTGAFAQDVGKLVSVMLNMAKNLGPVRGQIDQLEKQVRSL